MNVDNDMSRRVQGRGGPKKGPKLPFVLQQRLGLQDENSRGGGARGRPYNERRNDTTRNSARSGAGPPPRKRARIEQDVRNQREPEGVSAMRKERASTAKVSNQESSAFDDEDEDEGSDLPFDDVEDDDEAPEQPEITPAYTNRRDRSPSASDVDSLDEQIARFREASPEMNLDATSTSYRNKEAEEDAEILALEKRLGMKGGKKSKKPEFDDGFDGMLEQLEGAVDQSPRKQEKEWLKQKRAQQENSNQETSDASQESDSGSDSDGSDGAASFEGFDDETAATQRPPTKPRERENPYVAPVTTSPVTKYVPPSLRKPATSDTEQLQRLKRQAQGCLNKLSEANLISIVAEIETLYQSNPRQDVTDTIIDHILTAFSSRSALQNTYIILHAAFISALYKIIGSDFGAQLICKLVEAFDRYNDTEESTGKQCLNLISLLSNLFTFNVISSSILYDHIRLLLSSFSENTAELLLRIVRDCGPQLRADDPTSLKGIVATVNSITADLTRQGKPINVRTRVMIDTITDLKNNKTRHATSAAGITGEHITKMRKALGSLNSRQLRATEPLNITRNDIANSDKRGKWWLVGASWKGHDPQSASDPAPLLPQSNSNDDSFAMENEPDYQGLAQHYKMNTPNRRAIFTAILTATDARDCLTRLQKLRLTRKQEPEIPRVLLRCCRAEATYNPYYAVISRKLIQQDKKLKMAFAIALWKFFGELGEKQSDDDSDDEHDVETEKVQVREVANVSRMYASLIARGTLGLDVLKTLNVGMTGEDAGLFLELFFVTLLTDEKLSEAGLAGIFENVPEHLTSGIAWFLKKVVRKSDFVEVDAQSRLKKGLKIAQQALASNARLDNEI